MGGSKYIGWMAFLSVSIIPYLRCIFSFLALPHKPLRISRLVGDS